MILVESECVYLSILEYIVAVECRGSENFYWEGYFGTKGVLR